MLKTFSELLDGDLRNALATQQSTAQRAELHLPAHLRAHVRCVVRDRVLVLVADNAHWATRAHFHQSEILKSFRSDPDFRVQTIHTRVARDERPPDGTGGQSARGLPLDAETIRAVESASAGVSDPEISQAMQKIATAMRKKLEGKTDNTA